MGGASENNYLMQFQADILDVNVDRPFVRESTALGSAYIAGICVGMWNKKFIQENRERDRLFTPSIDDKERDRLYGGWKEAVGLSRFHVKNNTK